MALAGAGLPRTIAMLASTIQANQSITLNWPTLSTETAVPISVSKAMPIALHPMLSSSRYAPIRRAPGRRQRLHAEGRAARGDHGRGADRRDREALLAPAITRAVIEEFVRQQPASAPTAPPVAELTPREREVLDLLARGLSNSEICKRLVISEATAKTHVARILQKLDLRDRVQTVIYAYEIGLVTPGYSD